MSTFQIIRYGADPSENPTPSENPSLDIPSLDLNHWLRRYETDSVEGKRSVQEWAAEYKKFPADRKDSINKEVLKQWGTLPFYGDHCFGLIVDGETVSYFTARFSSKKSKNAWGRYIVWHFAYTPEVYRRRGYASQLGINIQNLAHAWGYKRVKSICQTYLGFRLHLSLGQDFWGMDKKNGTLVVDAALSPKDEFPDGIPIEARAAIGAHKLNNQELTNILLAHPYSISPQELATVPWQT
jgi:hypothetical protein